MLLTVKILQVEIAKSAIVSQSRHGTVALLMSDKTTINLRLRLPLRPVVLVLAAALLLPNRVWNTLLIWPGGPLSVTFGCRQLADLHASSRQLRYGWVAVGDRLEERFELLTTARFRRCGWRLLTIRIFPATVQLLCAVSRPTSTTIGGKWPSASSAACFPWDRGPSATAIVLACSR